jgi:hypothetical protein
MLRDIVHETPNHQNGAPTTQTTPNTPNGQNGRGEEGLHQRFQQAFLQGLQQAQKEILQELRLTLLQVIQARFPNLVRLAKKQSLLIEDSEILRDLIVKMSIAQTNEEAVLHLLAVDEDEEEEED